MALDVEKSVEIRDMKIKVIVMVLAAIAQTCFSQSAQQPAAPAAARPIDPRAMQMQSAVLMFKDVGKVEQLVKEGVDINAPIGCGDYSPLDGAVDTENLDMLKFLLAHGAKPKGRELANAAFLNNPDVAMTFAKELLAAGVSPNATNRYSTPLTSAAYQGHRDLVVLLIAQPGIKIDAPDVDGYTALMWAASHGESELVDLLMKAGANPKLKNNRGETAASLAEEGIATRRTIISKLEAKR